MEKELVMILAGGQGTRLYPLTRDRAKPAVPFGGKYRIIDFVLNNFVNAGFLRIKVLTQFMSDSLNRHISRCWNLSSMVGHYIDLVPAQMRTGESWYKGTADAIFQNFNLITDENPDHLFVFGGDHIYKMDVRQMLEFHKDVKSDLTVACVPMPLKEAASMGVVEVDPNGRIIGWEEKPKHPKPMPGHPDKALVSMGNYIFNTRTILSELTEDAHRQTSHDFGKDIIPNMIGKFKVYAYDFTKNNVPGMEEKERGYWRDVGTIDAYYEANMDLISVIPQLNLYNREWPIRTLEPHYPPAKFVFANEAERRVGRALDSLVCEGVILSGGEVIHSILSPGVRINSFAQVVDSIVMEGVDVGRHCRIRRAIIDKEVAIPAHAEIGYDLEQDRKRFHVTDSGIVVVPKKEIIPQASESVSPQYGT